MTKGNQPGDGERSAMLGYVPQYEIAAHIIYDALIDGTLEWFRVADPDAGTVDDIQISTTGRLDAYQVKWAEFTRDEFSFNDLIRSEVNKSGNRKLSLFEQLVQGWKKFKKIYPEKNVNVHLIHKQVPSANPNAKLPVDVVIPKYNHFQAFLKECWQDRSWSKNGLSVAPECWMEALKRLKSIAKLDETDFLSFVSACELSFNYKNPYSISINNQNQNKRKKDIDEIYNLLTKMAGGEPRLIELTKDKLLEKLSWKIRFQHRFVHEFPIEYAYQPISETVAALETCISTIHQGYIALLGAPGSGKSTTLTHTLKYKKGYRLVRYYAYVPDSTYQARGEANTFLHDITLSLKKYGFQDNSNRQPESREELQALLGEQLQQAHKKWCEDGIVTLIMIDGLDHVQREQNPQQSLLADLPHPSSISEGILFILGSQTLELDNLSDAIKVQIESKNRLIVMSALSKQNVYSIIDMCLRTTSITADEKEIIYKKSSGHPLSLIYLVQLISEKSNLSCSELLDTVPDYQGNIEQIYSIYWKKIEKNLNLFKLLALLSRIRIPININKIEKWADPSTIQDFVSNVSHYFRKESETNWYFFHNSFRQFILDKTGRNQFNLYDEAKHISYHEKLADFCSTTEQESPLHWERIYHLYNAKKWEDVIGLGQQDYFRHQFFNLRHLDNITDDLTCVLLAAKQLQDPLAVIQCLLIETELNERQETLNQVDILQLLFSAMGVEVTLSYMFDGRRLRVSETDALNFAKVLLDNDFSSEAKLIFDEAEPLVYLSGSEAVETTFGGSDAVMSWVDIAHYFMELEDIISTILQTRYEQNDSGVCFVDDEDLHFLLIQKLVDSIYFLKNEEKIKLLLSLLRSKDEFDEHLISLCFSICIEDFPSSEVNNAIELILIWASQNELSDSEKLLIAEIVFRVNSDRDGVTKWLENIKQPDLYKFNTGQEWGNLKPFADRIRLNRLYAALGCELTPIIAVPNADDTSYQGNVFFERLLVKFANIWGKAWKKEDVSSDIVLREIQPAFSLFLKGYSETRDWLGWYEIERGAVDFYKFTIRAVSQHGTSCILSLAEVFRAQWEKQAWATSWRREIGLALYQAGDSREYLVDSLNKIEQEIDEYDDVYSRVSEYTDLAITWAKIGKAQRAKNLLPKIFKGSFGINYHKDRQFSHWVSWLGKITEQFPELVQEDIRRFSSALVNLEFSRRGRGTQEAARDLIAISTSWDIRYGVELVNWLFDKKGLNYVAGITGLLQGMLKRNNPPCHEIAIVADKLLIPFEEYNSSDLPELLSYSCYQYSTELEAREQLNKIAKSISINLLPSNRYAWWAGIVHGMRKAGRNPSEYISKAMATFREKRSTNEPTVMLYTNEKITKEEIWLTVNSVESLLELIRSVKSTDYFQWFTLIKPYLDLIDKSQLEELYNLIIPFDSQNNALAAIANKFVEFGEFDKANFILASLMGISDSKGWDVYWDGGSRQAEFKALIAIDPEKWRPKALECLVDDYIGEYRYPVSLIRNLEEIINIIFDKPNLSLIWEAITNHIFQLNDFFEIEEFPPLPNKTESGIADVDFLIRFIFKLFDISVPELEHMAYQAILGAFGVSRNRAVFAKELKVRLSQIGLSQIKALSILQGVVNEYADFVYTFKVELSALCASNDLCVRFMALELANKLSIEGAPIPEDRFILPFIYEIELPELENKKEAIPYSVITPGETFPDFGDSLEMIRPLSHEAELLGRMSGVPFQNILTRTTDLMKKIVPQEKWNKGAEEEFKGWLRGIDLQLTYHRIRPQISKLSLSHVACELFDAGRISLNEINFLETFFRSSDRYMLSVEPIERPDFIEVPNAKDREQLQRHEDWVKTAEEALSLFHTLDKYDRIILGELTKWCWIDWEKPTETRLSMVCHNEWPNWDTPKNVFSFFPNKMTWRADNYPDIKGIDELSLVIYGLPVNVDLGAVEWLAFNPIVGKALGWSFSPDGFFRWIDKSGEIMVESIFWKDGPIGRRPPKMDDVCSDGWLVVATPKAVDLIRQLTGKIIKIDAVVRCYGNNSDSLECGTVETRNPCG